VALYKLYYYYYYYYYYYLYPGRLVISFQGGSKIKYKEIKLEWFLIRLVLNRKAVVQQDRVKVLHDNRNMLEKKDHLSVIARGR